MTQKVSSDFGGRVFIEWLRGEIAEIFNGTFEAGEERFARLASIQMLFESFAKRVIHLFVQIVGKLGEKLFAGGWPFSRMGKIDPMSLWFGSFSTVLARMIKFPPDKKPSAM